MKVQIENKVVLDLNATQKKVICNDIRLEIFESDMTRRVKYWLEIPCEKYVHHNRQKIEGQLKANGSSSIPTNGLKMGALLCDKKFIPKKCKVGNDTFELSEDHLKVWHTKLENQSKSTSELDTIIEARAAWILNHKYKKCLERLKLEWLPKLEARGIDSIPIDDEDFAKLVFEQADYQSRSDRDKEGEEHIPIDVPAELN